MLEVIEAGLLTTVQDGGRPQAVQLGVPVGGACDQWGLAVANAVLSNRRAAAALELTLLGPSLRAQVDCVVGIGGAEMGARVDETGLAVRAGTGVVLRAGQTLRFGAVEGAGARVYLALTGGVDVPDVLGSRSTCLAGGFGGLDGRPLRVGDVIGGQAPELVAPRPWPGPAALLGRELRVLRGPHLDRLPPQTFEALVGGEWQVGGRGDRQGIVLDGPPLDATIAPPLLSEGVVWGAVQLPPGGQPIVLLADHQTVGGYPVAAVVISADRPLLGQLGPGDEVRLVEVDAGAARAALIAREDALASALAGR
ncbi:MAG TPA: biotin-dependent carboxyltransferase family protein [Candidatus Limnocylindrales bacterium]|jgi:biotin-dependent carboxylase-like uncharacterized protein